MSEAGGPLDARIECETVNLGARARYMRGSPAYPNGSTLLIQRRVNTEDGRKGKQEALCPYAESLEHEHRGQCEGCRQVNW